MAGHNCHDGSHGNFKPAREIIHVKAKMPLIVDDRMLNTVNFSGIKDLGLLLAASEQYLYLFSESQSLLEECIKEAPNYEKLRFHLLIKDNNSTQESYTLYNISGTDVKKDPRSFVAGTNIFESWKNVDNFDNFCDILEKNTFDFIPLPIAGMLILRSIATVFPLDTYLGRHYLAQYVKARNDLTNEDRDLLIKIKEEGLPRIDDSYNERVLAFLKIERKLYTQYSH